MHPSLIPYRRVFKDSFGMAAFKIKEKGYKLFLGKSG
jgi:hypothetical protein